MHLQYQWQYLFFEEDSNSIFPKEPHLFSQLDATTHLGCHYSYTHIPMLWNHDLDSQHLNMLWVLLQDFNVWYFAKHYKEGGIHPIILFFWIAKYWSFVKVPRFVGISSDKSLKLTRKTMMLVQLDKLLGILPLSVLFCNCKNWILCKRPSSRGISLWKLLFWRVRFLKKLKFPIYGEMEPTSFRDCKSNTVTLWCRQPQVILAIGKSGCCHSKLKAPRGSWMILALNSSNAERSVSLFPPITEVTSKPHHKRRIKTLTQKDEDGGAELMR